MENVMKKQFIMAAMLVFMVSSPAFAGAATSACHSVNVQVNGLVCDFCARALEKVFTQRDEVKAIAVDLDKGNVTITMQPDRTIDDTTLNQLITDSGYTISAIERGCNE